MAGAAEAILNRAGWASTWKPNEATRRILGRIPPEEMDADIDWDSAVQRFGSPTIPAYVRAPIHGVEGGYSSPWHATGYDSITRELFAAYAGDERGYRDGLPAAATIEPERILDVACGTGESTLGWHRHFPTAEIVALDISPYMLAVAERKVAGVPQISLRCADAEALPFSDGSFDVVTASFLFHELPQDISPVVLAEMRRVIREEGELVVLEPYHRDGPILHPIPFPEPFLKDFLGTDWDQAFARAGFMDIRVVETASGWVRAAKAG